MDSQLSLARDQKLKEMMISFSFCSRVRLSCQPLDHMLILAYHVVSCVTANRNGCECWSYTDFVSELEAIRRQVTDIDGAASSTPSPIVVHCSAGVGRTGVVILIAVMKASLERNQVLQFSRIYCMCYSSHWVTPLTSTWPHLRCHVGLEEEEY